MIEHGRRRILHFNVTAHPTVDRVIQQLREAFPDAGPCRYAILDRDSKLDANVIAFLKCTGLKPKRTSVQAPWQNGIAERWVGRPISPESAKCAHILDFTIQRRKLSELQQTCQRIVVDFDTRQLEPERKAWREGFGKPL